MPRRRWRRFLLIGLAGYLIALLIALPARFVIDWGPRWKLAGTLWNGEAVFDDAYRLTWRWAPLRSLAAFAFAADVRLDGAGTDIAGSVISAGSRLRFDGLSGRADGALLAGLVPGLPFSCDVALEVTLPRLILDRARSSAVGEVRFGSGSCAAPDAAAPTTTPPLIATLRSGPGDTTLATLAPVGQARLHLAEGSIADGRLRVNLTPTGQAAMPFARDFAIDRAL